MQAWNSHLYQSVSSVTQSCLTVFDPMDCSTPGFPVCHQLPELTQTQPIESVMPSNHLILCHPLLLPPSVFPSIRVFSDESILRIRWPKYWSFSFSISPSNEYPGLISFKMDWLDLLAVQGTLKSLLQHHVQLFATPWTAARQASLPTTNSQRLLKLMSIALVMPSNHLVLCLPLLLPPSIFPSIRVFSVCLLKC